jgi:hypothetical protein
MPMGGRWLGEALLLPPVDAELVFALERIRHLVAAGTIDLETAGWLTERAHDALEAELERREQPRMVMDCLVCGGSGTVPHRPGCPYLGPGWPR